MRKLKRVPWCLFLIVFLTIGTIIMIYPFIWMVSASFKEVAEMYQIPPTVIPRNPTIKNYLVVFQQMGLLAAMYKKQPDCFYQHHRAANADRVISGVCVCEIALPGKEFYFYHLHGGYDGSGAADDYSQLLYCQALGLMDSLGSLIALGAFSAFAIFLIRQFFMSLPLELDDAAKIDGCGYFRSYLLIHFPLAKSVLSVKRDSMLQRCLGRFLQPVDFF